MLLFILQGLGKVGFLFKFLSIGCMVEANIRRYGKTWNKNWWVDSWVGLRIILQQLGRICY